jgi:hypothetical protein
LTVLLNADYDAWAERARESERYSVEKRSVAESAVIALDEQFPGAAAIRKG